MAQLAEEQYGLAAVMVPSGRDQHNKGRIIEGNIPLYLPDILHALQALDLNDTAMLMMSLATIRAEASQSEPIDEIPSRFNTSPPGSNGGHNFDRYDRRLGNVGAPDGDTYKGRGFVQLTGRANYKRIGSQIGYDLENNPAAAGNSRVAARILARFLKDAELPIRAALNRNDLPSARTVVNGGSHGLRDFMASFMAGRLYLHLTVAAPVARRAARKANGSRA